MGILRCRKHFCGDGEAVFSSLCKHKLEDRMSVQEVVDGEGGYNVKLAKRPKIQRHSSDTTSEVDWLSGAGSNFGAFQLLATKGQKHKTENTSNVKLRNGQGVPALAASSVLVTVQRARSRTRNTANCSRRLPLWRNCNRGPRTL